MKDKILGLFTDLKIVAILILAVYIIYLQQCSCLKTGDSETGNIVSTDTTLIISRIDTIRFTDTVDRIVKVRIPVPVKDTILIGDFLTEVERYETDVTDSLIEGKILSTVRGELVSQILMYNPLFPKFVVKTDTVFIKETILKPKLSAKLLFGGRIGGSKDLFSLAPQIALQTKNSYVYGYSYDLSLKSHNISILIPLNFKRK